ncbi:MAG: TonB-dependent receptor [Opitutales bacterium]
MQKKTINIKTNPILRSVFILVLMSPLPGAQEDSRAQVATAGNAVGGKPVYQLEEFVVTGTALPMRSFEAASDISMLAGREKLRRQAANLGETLDHLPSVSTIKTGSGVGKPVIRGLSGNRIRVLQDGVGVNFQQYGVRHPPNLDPSLAGRIEVVRGVSSILYGSDAFGGAVNAISPEIDYAVDGNLRQGGRMTYGYESGHDLHAGAVEFNVASERWGVVGAVSYRDAGNIEAPDVETFDGTGTQPSDIPKFAGELDFTDFEQLNGMIKAGYQFGAAEGSLRYESWDNEHNFLLPNGKGIGQALENNLVQAELDGALTGNWDWKTSYTWNENIRRSNPGGRPLPLRDPAIDLERDSHTLRGEFIRGGVDDWFSGTFGMEGIYEDQKSKGSVGLTPGGQVYNLAVFGMGRMAADPWTFEAGLRFDYRSQEADASQTADDSLLVNRVDPVTGAPVDMKFDNDYNVATASLGAIHQVSDALAIAGNVNRGYRAPELFELYVGGVHGGVAAFQFGDPSLDEETSLGGDLQARWRSDRLDWTATGYVTSFSDYIFLGDTGATHPGSGLPVFRVDQADATLYGGDFSVIHRTTDWLTLEGAYEWVRGEFDDGGDVPFLPADQLQLEAVFHRESLGWVADPEFRIGVRHARSKDAAGALEPFSQFDRNPNFGTASTGDYTLLDLGFGFRYKNLHVDVFAKNVTDEDYRDFLDTYKGYALSPGRSIGIRTSLDF